MHNGQRREAVKGARLNLITKFYDYSGREQPHRNAYARAHALTHALRARSTGASDALGPRRKKSIRISRDEERERERESREGPNKTIKLEGQNAYVRVLTITMPLVRLKRFS